MRLLTVCIGLCGSLSGACGGTWPGADCPDQYNHARNENDKVHDHVPCGGPSPMVTHTSGE